MADDQHDYKVGPGRPPGGRREGNVIVDFVAAIHSVGLRRKPQ
jgi:hypothetical protein